MKRISFALACAVFLLATGCSKKIEEVSTAVKAETAMLISEAQFASSIREHARAEELIERAIKLREDVPEYWVSLGMARRQQDDKSGARKAYEKALGIHAANYKKTKDPEQVGHQAFVLGLLGRSEEGLKLLAKGIKEHPENTELKKMSEPRGLPNTFKSSRFKELAI